MSAFVLIVHPPGAAARTEEVDQLLAPVAYLGPHGKSLWAEANLAIGALLFSVAPEAARERQPLLGGDGRYLLAADARLDDRAGLLRRLGPAAGVDEGATDSELLLAAYLAWGEACLDQILGDYAFAVFDRQNQGLFAATDPLGLNRLFYTRSRAGAFVIASQEAMVLALPGLDLTWDRFAVGCWLLASPHRELSLFEEIHVLACGQSLTWTPQRQRVARWWQPDPARKIRYAHRGEYLEHYLEVMRAAVGDRLRSATGVVASELSGGIDSGTVTALAAGLVAGQGRGLVAISAVYPAHAECDEGDRIRASGAWLGIDHELLDMSEVHAQSYPLGFGPRPESLHAVDDPWAERMLGIAVAHRADVVLNGMGGDEMLFGAPQWVYAERLLRGDLGAIRDLVRFAQRFRLRSPWQELDRRLLRPLAGMALGPILPALRARRAGAWLPPWVAPDDALRMRLAERLFSSEVPRYGRRSTQSVWDGLRRSQSLMVIDGYRMNAARVGVDVRNPFFDLRLASFVLAVPPDLWHREGMTKWLARHALRGLLPPTVCWALDDRDFSGVVERAWRDSADIIAEQLRGFEPGSTPLLREVDLWLPRACDTTRQGPNFEVPASYALALVLFSLRRQFRI